MLEAWNKSLDDSFYAPDYEEKAFMQVAAGIESDEELRAHIVTVQTKAFSLYRYPCIRIFEFLRRLKMARLPAYPDLLKLRTERSDAILLDLGCCFGNDVRKAVLDGFPVQNVIASDLQPQFWELGHELFRSTPSTFPARFVAGDILDTSFISHSSPLPTTVESPSGVAPILSSVTSLNELKGHVSALFTGAFFHLFTFEQQTHIARLLAGLLSPLPGSMLFGVQGGRTVKSLWTPGQGTQMHGHSPESWQEMWEEIFGEAGVKVAVNATLRKEMGGDDFFGTWPGNTDPYQVLEWSVMRV
ncbi:hypothetical protein OH76DRAFT_1545423 [Lentinus brumalis]|uniref:Methyltransferase domain-containing protein n=1 Tax=Lentinus brumalis TaxID=2498619 RepID=A0A371DLH3_9APHY|nr:hypothetical protein OH76DRAFT_1545423 [Polyporus brumalis]